MCLGHFLWSESLEEPIYTNWRNTEPNNAGGNEDCTVKDTQNGWGDYNCDWDNYGGRNFHALCEI